MSVTLSIELLIAGSKKDLSDFWTRLKPGDKNLNSQHFQTLLGKRVDPNEEIFDGFDVQLGKTGRSINISWVGGFGPFDCRDLGTTFRDYCVELSEQFPTLDFTLYFDSQGADFGGGFGVEMSEGGVSEQVYAGGIRYRAGVRIGEKTLALPEYYARNQNHHSNHEEDDELDEYEDCEPDYENNRRKIDQAIQEGRLRSSTLYYRKKWLERSMKDDGSLVEATRGQTLEMTFSREFWREVPLVNTDPQFIDSRVASAAIRQCPYSAIFVPDEVISVEDRKFIENSHLLQILINDDIATPETKRGIVFGLASRLLIELALVVQASPALSNHDMQSLVQNEEADNPPKDSTEELQKAITRMAAAIDKLVPDASDTIASLYMAMSARSISAAELKLLVSQAIRLLCNPDLDSERT